MLFCDTETDKDVIIIIIIIVSETSVIQLLYLSRKTVNSSKTIVILQTANAFDRQLS